MTKVTRWEGAGTEGIRADLGKGAEMRLQARALSTWFPEHGARPHVQDGPI
jgi:hypothetical protein